jgi:hypothetical protein
VDRPERLADSIAESHRHTNPNANPHRHADPATDAAANGKSNRYRLAGTVAVVATSGIPRK